LGVNVKRSFIFDETSMKTKKKKKKRDKKKRKEEMEDIRMQKKTE